MSKTFEKLGIEFCTLNIEGISSISIDQPYSRALNHLPDVMEMALDGFFEAKERCIGEVISQIEGRPYVLLDAESIVLATLPPPNQHIEVLIYKDVEVGYLEYDFINLGVVFRPKAV